MIGLCLLYSARSEQFRLDHLKVNEDYYRSQKVSLNITT